MFVYLLRVKGKKQASKLDRLIWLPLLNAPLLPHLCVTHFQSLTWRFQMQPIIQPVIWRRGCAQQWDCSYPVCPVQVISKWSSKWSSVLSGISHGRFMYFIQCQEAHALGLSGCRGHRAKSVSGAGCCWKRVVGTSCGPVSLPVEPCTSHVPVALVWPQNESAQGMDQQNIMLKMNEVFFWGKEEISALCSLWSCGLSVQHCCALGDGVKAVDTS